MTNIMRDHWPAEAQAEIRKLRAENAKFRLERNEARQALIALTLKVTK